MSTDVLTVTEEQKVHTPEQAWSNSFALKVCQQDFQTAENYRSQSHDKRWVLADYLYVGGEKQRVWPGTKIPRSSLGMFVVLSQIESLLPKVLSSLFADNPWFEVGPEPGTSGQDALRVRGVMTRQMEQMRRFKNQSIREIFRRGIKDGLLYGVGAVEIEWMETTRKIRKISRVQVPVVGQMMHPTLGPIPVPTGQTREELREEEIEQVIQTPIIRHISARDVYVDPNHTNPQFQGARYVCTRGYMTVDELDGKRGEPGFSIPPKGRLIELAHSKPAAMADSDKVAAASTRGENYNPNIDASIDPGALRIEVITRWSADRSVWMLNREDLAYNAKNEYGFIPVFNAFYIDVPGRAYGLSVADVTEGEHRVQGALINARMDETALHIHGRTVKKRGQATPSHQMARKPGQVIEADNPKDDIQFDQINPMLQAAHIETNASEMRVQKITGITDLAVMGVGSSGGNSANRTATGVGAQVQAAFSRLTYLVENIEDTFVEPILSAWHYLNTQFMDPEMALSIAAKDGYETVDPLSILNAEVVFTMRASSKMQSRMALMQALPFILQHLMHPQLMSQIQRTGLTFDFTELLHVILDATGYKARGQLIRKMTPEEQQAYQQSIQQEQNAALVQQRERMADLKEIQDQKSTAELEQAVVDHALEAGLREDGEQAE